jgi:beta-glucosidase
MTETANAPYLNPDLPIDERVRDLVGRMTLAEKLSQMCNACPPIPRLGIPAYDYWSEALHGVARNGRATVFPQAIGMAATWDPDLVRRVASAIGDEARAKHHEAMRRNGGTVIYQGLTFWSPNINIFRDPRWGRGQETWGEDPHLTGEMGSAFVRGLQGDDPVYMKAAACAKHYAVHSGPEKLRHTFDAVVSNRDLYGTYLPAFRKLVMDAQVEAVMGAYNRVKGEPACASQLLLVENLRGKWGFQGHVVSDCGAINDIHQGHKVTADAAESSALAVKAGCDNACFCTYERLGEAIERGLITEREIDEAIYRTYKTRFKLGMFDPSERVRYAATPTSVIGCEEHRQLAYQAAVESVVLLKNRNNILPIKPDVKSICVVGPSAANLDVLLGNYSGMNAGMVTLIEGVTSRTPEGVMMIYRPGCQFDQPNASPFDWSVYQAAASDVTIAMMGLSPLMEGEEGDAILTVENGDRSDIMLAPAQADYLKKMILAGAKVVLVLTGGAPIALGELADMVEAVVYVWYPGEQGGNAVADVLFGNATPGGKLPLTFPQSLDQLPPFEDYNMAGRTHRFMTEEPLYPFGFGLSYTRFSYDGVSLSRSTVQSGESVIATITVTNCGEVAGDEVVQLYITDVEASVPVPQQNLIGFRRVRLEPGVSVRLAFEVTPEMMKLVNDAGELALEPGEFRLAAGGSAPLVRAVALGSPEPATASFTVGG